MTDFCSVEHVPVTSVIPVSLTRFFLDSWRDS